jgi:hypothetical protein
MATVDSQQAPFTPDSALTREEIEQRNLEIVAAHFHNENPDDVGVTQFPAPGDR